MDNTKGIPSWPAQARNRIMAASSEEELADVLGDLHSSIRALSNLKSEHDKEMPDVVVGERWRFERPVPGNKYSFNESGLLSLIMRQTGWNLAEALDNLKAEGVITIGWKISKLKPFLKRFKIRKFLTVTEPVADGDEYHVGIIDARVYPKYEAIHEQA